MKLRSLRKILITALITGFLFLPAIPAHAQTGGAAEAGVFSALEVAPGAVIEVPVEIRNASAVYAIDIEIQFDPAVLGAQDADPASPGVQIGLGEFLDPGLLLFNQVDLEKGVVRFAMSQVNPSEPKSGGGVLFVIYFKGLKEGLSPLRVTNLQVASREGTEIPSSPVDSSLTVKAGAPQTAATPVPVQDPGKAILLPTPGPSPTPSLAPTEIPSQTPAAISAQANPTEGPAESSILPEMQTQNQNPEKPFLVQNWWIMLPVLAAAAVLGMFVLKNKDQSNAEKEG